MLHIAIVRKYVRARWTACRPAEMASVFSGGEEPSARTGDVDVNFTAFRGGDGGPTTVTNAMFGFAPVFAIGQSTGTSQASGEPFDASYGEAATYEYS